MPFTPSHAAAVLPLMGIRVAGAGLPTSALVCGSIAPDLPYYVPLPFAELSTHSLTGAVGVSAVLAAGAWLVWHGLLAGPALAGAPAEVRARLASAPVGIRPRITAGRDLVALYVAFAIGALTHVVWDSFTHPHRWGTDRIDVLNEVYRDRPVSHWLQLASTAVGALALLAYTAARWRTLPRADEQKPMSAGAIAGWIAVMVAAGGGAIGGAVEQTAGGTHHGMNYMVLTRSITTAAVVALAVSAIWHARRIDARV